MTKKITDKLIFKTEQDKPDYSKYRKVGLKYTLIVSVILTIVSSLGFEDMVPAEQTYNFIYTFIWNFIYTALLLVTPYLGIKITQHFYKENSKVKVLKVVFIIIFIFGVVELFFRLLYYFS